MLNAIVLFLKILFSIYHGKQRKEKCRNFWIVIVIKFLFWACRCFSYKLFPFFFFSQRVLYYFIGKTFFRRIEAVAWRCFVLSILQNSSENACVAVLSFSEVAGYRPVTLLKRDSGTDVFLWILKKKIAKKLHCRCSTGF